MRRPGSGRRALVTGGAGFIGGHLVEALVDAGWSVAVLDDFSTGREENLARSRGRIDLIRGDVCDADAVAKAIAAAEVVFHHAAVPSVALSIAEPLRTHRVNLEGTVQLLDASRRNGVRRFLFASSAAVYGDGDGRPVSEAAPLSPRSPYGLHKVSGEMYCRQYAMHHGLESVVLRYFNVFGPRQSPEGEYAAVIPRFAFACVKGEAPRIYGDGKQTRDFIHVDDVVRANLLAADARGADGAILNVATGRPTNLLELLETLRDLTGARTEAKHEPAREGDVRFSAAAVARACEVLGFRPQVDLREGLRRLVAGAVAARS